MCSNASSTCAKVKCRLSVSGFRTGNSRMLLCLSPLKASWNLVGVEPGNQEGPGCGAHGDRALYIGAGEGVTST